MSENKDIASEFKSLRRNSDSRSSENMGHTQKMSRGFNTASKADEPEIDAPETFPEIDPDLEL